MDVSLRRVLTGLFVVGFSLLATAAARAEILTYYIGIDDLPTIASGTYGGLDNPNFNHLTFLFAHPSPDTPASNHYHSKAIVTYTGPNLGASTAVIRSTSNFVPEGTTPPIKLSAGTGIFAGKLVSNPYTNPADPTYESSFLTIGDTQRLVDAQPENYSVGPPASGEYVMHNSSAGRWNSNPRAAHLHAEIISLTPGLNIGNASTLSLGGVGTEIHLSNVGQTFSFTPVFWTDANAAPGVYEGVLRFFDEDGTYGDSGDIRFVMEVTSAVPEPGTYALLGLGGIFLLRRTLRARV